TGRRGRQRRQTRRRTASPALRVEDGRTPCYPTSTQGRGTGNGGRGASGTGRDRETASGVDSHGRRRHAAEDALVFMRFASACDLAFFPSPLTPRRTEAHF